MFKRLQYIGSKQTKIELTKKEATELLNNEGCNYLDKKDYNNFKDDLECLDSLELLEQFILDLQEVIFDAKEKEVDSIFDYEDETRWYLARVL